MQVTCWRSKDELINDVLQWTPSHGRTSVDDPLELIYDNALQTQDVV